MVASRPPIRVSSGTSFIGRDQRILARRRFGCPLDAIRNRLGRRSMAGRLIFASIRSRSRVVSVAFPCGRHRRFCVERAIPGGSIVHDVGQGLRNQAIEASLMAWDWRCLAGSLWGKTVTRWSTTKQLGDCGGGWSWVPGTSRRQVNGSLCPNDSLWPRSTRQGQVSV